jgi:hypothetical protein
VVVEPVEDLCVGAVGQSPVGEVGLPAFVGLFGGEPDVGALGALTWLGLDQAVVVQDAADGGGRRDRQALSSELALERQWPSVEAFGGEPFALQYHRCDDVVADPARVADGTSGSGFNGVKATELVALEQAVDVLARQSVRPRCAGDGEMTAGDFENDNTRLGHESRLSPMTRLISDKRTCYP